MTENLPPQEDQKIPQEDQKIPQEDQKIPQEDQKMWCKIAKIGAIIVVIGVVWWYRDVLPTVDKVTSLKFFFWTIIGCSIVVSIFSLFGKNRTDKFAKSIIFIWTLLALSFAGNHLQDSLTEKVPAYTQNLSQSDTSNDGGQLFFQIIIMVSCCGIVGSCLNNLRLVIKYEEKSEFSSSKLPTYIYRPLVGAIAGVVAFLLFVLTGIAEFEFSTNLATWAHIKPYAVTSFIAIIAGFGSEKFLTGFSEIAQFIILKFVEAIKAIFGQNQAEDQKQQVKG